VNGADSGTGRTSAETSAPVDSGNFCHEHGLPVPDTVRASHGAFGTYAARCSACSYVCAYWDCACELVHDCDVWQAVPVNVFDWAPVDRPGWVVRP
jgi:hypothetical protein